VFVTARTGGASIRAAHLQAKAVAERRGRYWPKRERTVAGILARDTVAIEEVKPSPSLDPNEHLVRKLSAN